MHANSSVKLRRGRRVLHVFRVRHGYRLPELAKLIRRAARGNSGGQESTGHGEGVSLLKALGGTMAITFDIRFDGMDAAQHQIDMRQLGRSMMGLDRAISDAVFLATENRLPLPKERRSLVVRVEAPVAACVELHGVIVAASGMLPLAYQIISDPGTKFLFQFMSFLLKWRGGKRKDAEVHLMEAHRLLMADRKDERASMMKNEEQWRQFSLDLVDRLAAPLREVVAPLGQSSETLTLAAPAGDEATVIDVAMAEAVRSKEPLEVGDMTKFRVRVDGVIKHSRQLKVEIEGQEGRFVSAEVRDPIFDSGPNVYTRALSDAGYLEVDAKPTYRDGELVKLHIMDAE